MLKHGKLREEEELLRGGNRLASPGEKQAEKSKNRTEPPRPSLAWPGIMQRAFREKHGLLLRFFDLLIGFAKLALSPARIFPLNVGVVINKRFEELTSDHWQRAFALNCFSHAFAYQRVIPHMKRQGQGTIVFTGPDQGLQPEAGLAAYAMAKAAIHALVKVLARELPPYHIFVSAVAPGKTETPLARKLIQAYADNEFHTDFTTAQRLELQRRGNSPGASAPARRGCPGGLVSGRIPFLQWKHPQCKRGKCALSCLVMRGRKTLPAGSSLSSTQRSEKRESVGPKG